MLQPLFSKDSELVGWIEPGQHIFDPEMEWVAYIALTHAWSAGNDHWLGPVRELSCIDHDGYVVAWNSPDAIAPAPTPSEPPSPSRRARPPRPNRPPRPPRPARPNRPPGGWSETTFAAWLAQ